MTGTVRHPKDLELCIECWNSVVRVIRVLLLQSGEARDSKRDFFAKAGN